MAARYKNAIMWTVYGLLFLFVLVLQTVVFGAVRYSDTKISLLPLVIACVAMHTGAEQGGLFGLAAGTVWCLSGGDGGGVLILLCTVCAVLAGHLCDHILNRNLISAIFMCLLCLSVTQFALLLLKLYLGQCGAEGWMVLLKQVAFSMLACPPIYLAAWIIRKAGADR